MTASIPRSRGARARKVARAEVELWRYVLEKPVGGSGVGHVDVVVVDLEDDQGQTASGFSYVLAASGEDAVRAARHLLDRLVIGRPLVHPEILHRRARAGLNRTGRGPLYIGLAAVDLAIWDLYAKALGIPLGVAMGGDARSVRVYGSGGLRAGQDPDEAAERCRRYVDAGLTGVKPRVTGVPADRRLVTQVCAAVGDRAFVAVDANEKCLLASAEWLMSLGREYGLLFVEEPLPARDLAAYRALAAARSGPALATGEHLQGLDEVAPFLVERLCHVIQPDLAMMGGLTECLRVARLAEAVGAEVAPHFLPNLFVHLAAASPSVTWLEDFPLLEPLFGSPPTFDSTGVLGMPDDSGHGLSWAEGARQSFRITNV